MRKIDPRRLVAWIGVVLIVVVFWTGVALLLAGCGGGGKSTTVTSTTTVTTSTTGAGAGTLTPQQAQQDAPVVGHPCDPAHIYLQCVLRSQRGGLKATLPPVGTTIYARGVDFAWGGPRSCSAMHNIGAQFGSGYLSNDFSKNWDAPLVATFHKCGIATTAVWETTASRAGQGESAGRSDATSALALAIRYGFPSSRPITFAIDFDASGGAVSGYFRGCHAVLGDRCNAYGGYRPLAYLCANHLVGHWNWQTYAWSGGLWLPPTCAPLEQWLNDNSVDYDRATAPDYGQTPAPHVGPSDATIRSWRDGRDKAFAIYHSHGCKAPQTGNQTPASFGTPNVCRDQGNNVVVNQGKLWTVYPRWACFGPGAKVKSQVCWIVRPEVNYWSGARAATDAALRSHTCRKPYRRAICRQLGQRRVFFDQRATSTVAAYSKVGTVSVRR